METFFTWVALFLCLWAPLASASCPAIEDIPVVHPHLDYTFECARIYPGAGYVADQLACNSCPSEGNYEWNCPDNGEVI